MPIGPSLTPPSDPEKTALIVVIRVAHRTLMRYCRGETEVLQTLNPQVAAWLEFHEYIEEVLNDDGEMQYEVTEKGRRAVMGSGPVPGDPPDPSSAE